MPVFCARWPDGSFSIVDADDNTHALIQLDELGDEPADIWPLQSCLLDFELTEDGTFRLLQFGEETGPEIMERAYPVLNNAQMDEAFAGHPMAGRAKARKNGSEAAEALRKAVEVERERLRDFQPAPAATEQGKSLQREHGGSRVYIDAIVEQAATGRLQRYKPGKNLKPS